jgi:hypothetical protein
MLINVIALGDSASKWDGSGDSIGVNDAYRWGHKLQRLVLLNGPNEFDPEERDYIRATNADFTYTCYPEWSRLIRNTINFQYSVWQGSLKLAAFQTSKTSPFCAISIAYNLGYDEIVLWGVDFKTHPIWHSKNPNYYTEIKNYQDLAARLKEKGVNVYTSEPSVLRLPVYEKQIA